MKRKAVDKEQPKVRKDSYVRLTISRNDALKMFVESGTGPYPDLSQAEEYVMSGASTGSWNQAMEVYNSICSTIDDCSQKDIYHAMETLQDKGLVEVRTKKQYEKMQPQAVTKEKPPLEVNVNSYVRVAAPYEDLMAEFHEKFRYPGCADLVFSQDEKLAFGRASLKLWSQAGDILRNLWFRDAEATCYAIQSLRDKGMLEVMPEEEFLEMQRKARAEEEAIRAAEEAAKVSVISFQLETKSIDRKVMQYLRKLKTRRDEDNEFDRNRDRLLDYVNRLNGERGRPEAARPPEENPGLELKRIITGEPFTTFYRSIISCLFNELDDIEGAERYFPLFVSGPVMDKRGNVFINFLPKENDKSLEPVLEQFDAGKYSSVLFAPFKVARVEQFSLHPGAVDTQRRHALYVVDQNGVIERRNNGPPRASSTGMSYTDANGGVYKGSYLPDTRMANGLETLANAIGVIAGEVSTGNVVEGVKQLERSNDLPVRTLFKLGGEAGLRNGEIRDLVKKNVDKVNAVRSGLLGKIGSFQESGAAVYYLHGVTMEGLCDTVAQRYKKSYYGFSSVLGDVRFDLQGSSLRAGEPVNMALSEIAMKGTEQNFFIYHPASPGFAHTGSVRGILAELERSSAINGHKDVRFRDVVAALPRIDLLKSADFSESTITSEVYKWYAEELEKALRKEVLGPSS